MAVKLGGNNTVFQFLDLIQDNAFLTVDEVSYTLGISRDVADKLFNFCAGCGFIKYWRSQGVIQSAGFDHMVA
jgi:predicted transcriptional regulator